MKNIFKFFGVILKSTLCFVLIFLNFTVMCQQLLMQNGGGYTTTNFWNYSDKLGIGTNTPSGKLHLHTASGGFTATALLKETIFDGTNFGAIYHCYKTGGINYGIYQTSSNIPMLNYFKDPIKIGRAKYWSDDDNNSAVTLDNNAPKFTFYFPVDPTPDEPLEPLVIYPDRIKVPSFQLTTSPGINKILVSDANGIGSWTLASELLGQMDNYWALNELGDIYTLARRVGIGTDRPTQKLEINHTDEQGGIVLNQTSEDNNNNTTEIRFERKGIEKTAIGYTVTGDDRHCPSFFIWNNVLNNSAYFLDLSNGMTGIGTSWPSAFLEVAGSFRATAVGIGILPPSPSDPYKLWVEGGIAAREVKVTINEFPDYCFNSDYDLMSLKDLRQYILDKKHLPNIPTSEEVKSNNGIELGEMEVKLLRKIEEQTLYILDLQRQIEEMREIINKMEENK